jgi:RNA polymerase sigma-70 factor (ECF subfamily)
MSTREAVAEHTSPLPPPNSLPLVGPELRAAFLLTLERRRPQLERVAMSMMRCQQDAEDVVQESVLKALRFLPRFRGDARIDTWLHAIVVNTARDWLRLRRQRAQLSLETESEQWEDVLTLDFPCPDENPEESCSRRELLCHLEEEIRRLDPRYRMPIRLCDLHGHSYREAARMLKITNPAMKARLFRARVLLKKRLSWHSAVPIPTASQRRRRSRRRLKSNDTAESSN